MTDIELPAPVRAYLTAHTARDAEAAVATFTPDATVTDEGKTYSGRDEILLWRRHASTAWTYTSEITGSRQEADGTWVVAMHLEGDFPGGVADVEQRFSVRDGALTEPRIV